MGQQAINSHWAWGSMVDFETPYAKRILGEGHLGELARRLAPLG